MNAVCSIPSGRSNRAEQRGKERSGLKPVPERKGEGREVKEDRSFCFFQEEAAPSTLSSSSSVSSDAGTSVAAAEGRSGFSGSRRTSFSMASSSLDEDGRRCQGRHSTPPPPLPPYKRLEGRPLGKGEREIELD